MKKLFRTEILFTCVIAATLIFFTSCSENSVDSGDRTNTEVGENFTFYKDESMAEEADKNRSEEISDPFEIDSVTINDENGTKWMHIEVTQTMGCEGSYPEKFSVIWDGIMLMIYPPQVGFYLTFDSSGCSGLQENVKETITLDLYEIFGDKDFVDSVAKFTVVNASDSSPESDHEVGR